MWYGHEPTFVKVKLKLEPALHSSKAVALVGAPFAQCWLSDVPSYTVWVGWTPDATHMLPPPWFTQVTFEPTGMVTFAGEKPFGPYVIVTDLGAVVVVTVVVVVLVTPAEVSAGITPVSVVVAVWVGADAFPPAKAK